MDSIRRGPSRIALAELAIGIPMLYAGIVGRPRGDGPALFLTIADKVAAGLVAYRDFPLEYPPLALLPLALPRFLSGPSPDAYTSVFSAVSLALTLASAAALAWLASRGWSALSVAGTLIAFLALAFAAAPQVLWRFDILPALLTILALVAVAAGRPAWAGLALGLGTAAKLYPAFVVPVLLGYYFFSRRRASVGWLLFGFVVTVGALFLPIYLIAGTDAFSFLTYQEERGVEIESVVGGIVLLSHNIFGSEAVVHHAFGSFQVASTLIGQLALPNAAFQVVLGIALAVRLITSFREDERRQGKVAPRTLVRYLLATLLLVMLTNKVLSPQYICWLLPFGALLPWRQSLLLVVISALTTFEFPIAFTPLMNAEPLVVVALNVRNLLLLVLFVWLILPVRHEAEERQSVAMLEKPPSRPAPTPNISSPMASRRLRGAMTVISSAAKATVTILASVSPGRPSSAAR